MRYAIPFLFVASPALAHHEVVMTASLVPLAMGLVTITVAGLAAWRKKRGSKSKY